MVKLNRHEERATNQDMLMHSSDAATDLNLLGEDWVIVKKQRVNILIPPLQGSYDSASKELDNDASDHQVENASEEPLVAENDEPSSAAMENTPLTASIPNHSNDVVAAVNHGKMSPRKWNESEQDIPQKRGDVLKTRKTTVLHCGSKTIKQPRLSPGEFNLNHGHAPLTKMMKASNLERKLLRTGGLSRWLTSLGLEQLIRIFRGRQVSKFQLVNLSMRKLKDMGIHAVGPRRKLIHATECVCHPYCFETL